MRQATRISKKIGTLWDIPIIPIAFHAVVRTH
jgi:hypothetical protein